MPNIKSAKKRMRQNPVRRTQNRQRKSTMRTVIKKLNGLIEQGNVDEARELLPQVYKVIDRTAQDGVIHSNTASRYKSRLTRQLNRQAQ